MEPMQVGVMDRFLMLLGYGLVKEMDLYRCHVRSIFYKSLCISIYK